MKVMTITMMMTTTMMMMMVMTMLLLTHSRAFQNSFSVM